MLRFTLMLLLLPSVAQATQPATSGRKVTVSKVKDPTRLRLKAVAKTLTRGWKVQLPIGELGVGVGQLKRVDRAHVSGRFTLRF